MSQISKDIRHADFLEQTGDSSWLIQYWDRDEVCYLFKDSVAYRNGLVIGPDEVVIHHFSIEMDSSWVLNEEHAAINYNNGLVKIRLKIVSEKSVLDLYSQVGMRQQIPWPHYVY